MAHEAFDMLNNEFPYGRSAVELNGNIIGEVEVAAHRMQGAAKTVLVPGVDYHPVEIPNVAIPMHTAAGWTVFSPRLDNPKLSPTDARHVFDRENDAYIGLSHASFPDPNDPVVPETRVENGYTKQKTVPFSESQQAIFNLFAAVLKDNSLDYLLDPALVPYKESVGKYILLSSIAASLVALRAFHSITIPTGKAGIVRVPVHKDLILHFDNILIDLSKGPDSFAAYLVDLSETEFEEIDLNAIPALPTIHSASSIREEDLAVRSIMNSWLSEMHLLFTDLPQEQDWNADTMKNLSEQAFVALHFRMQTNAGKDLREDEEGKNINQLHESLRRSLLRLIIGSRINNGRIAYGLRPHTAPEIDAIIATSWSKLLAPHLETGQMPVVRPDQQ